MKEMIFLNGEFILKENAFISPNDRGFIFGDGIYEVTKYYFGKPLRIQDHMERLKRNLVEIQLEYKELNILEEVSMQLLEMNGLLNEQAAIYIQVTRGVHKRMHQFPKGIEPTVYAFAMLMPSAREKLENGIKVITQEDIRWHRCDIKSVSLLGNTMLLTKAAEAGAGESILTRNGVVTEATHSNVLAVKDKKVVTHPLSNLILPGITRKIILEICRRDNIPVEERAFTEEELFGMNEIMIAGTGSEITPVIQVNDKPVGNKKPGEITRFLQEEFFKLT